MVLIVLEFDIVVLQFVPTCVIGHSSFNFSIERVFHNSIA